MTKSEWALWVVSLAASIFGVLFALFQYFNKRGRRKIHVVRRAFFLTLCSSLLIWIFGLFFFISGKSIVVLAGDSPLNSGIEVSLVYGLQGTDLPSSVGIPIWIKNDGNQSVENITITFIYNSNYIMPLLQDQSKQTGLGSIKNMDRETHSSGGVTSSTIHINSIGPGQKLYAAEPFIWTTDYLSQINRLIYPTVTIKVNISAQDIPVRRADLTVSALPGISFDEVSSNHVKLSSSLKFPGEIIVVISPFRVATKEGSQLYVSDTIRIQTKRYLYYKNPSLRHLLSLLSNK